jgi:3-hydroxyisobutyrate dehydrogenase-like beta-hydroxyacid dehydrogenase
MRIGVVGLGLMGKPIARRLLGAGHEVTVYNRTASRADELVEQGAARAGSPAEVWDSADACITMVADDDALAAVLLGADGLLASPPAGRTLIDMSTVSVEASKGIAEAAERAGVGFLRAPVSGNPTVVEAGNLTIVVSGDAEAFRHLEQTLRDVGPNVFYLGPGEEARVLKLALNLMIAGTAEVMAEAIALGEASGLDRAAMLDVMSQSAVGSPFVKYKTGPLLANDFQATFTAAMMHKDLKLALAAGEAAGVPLPLTDSLRALFADCLDKGLGDLDLMVLLPRLEREAGRPSSLPA